NRFAAERLINILNQGAFLWPHRNGSDASQVPASSCVDCLSRHGKFRVRREGASFRVIDTGTSNSIVFVGNAHSGPIRSLQFSRDGQRIVSASADATAKIWNARSGALICSLTNKHAVTWAEFSPDG